MDIKQFHRDRKRHVPTAARFPNRRAVGAMAMLAAVLVGLAVAPGAQAQQPTVTVSWGASRYVAAEGGGQIALALHLDQAPGREVTVDLAFTYLSGATAADHTIVPSRVVFRPTDTVRYLLVRAIDDAWDDDGTTVLGESVLLDIGTPSPGSGVVIGDIEETTVVFLDNDGELPPSIPRFRAATPGDGTVTLNWVPGLPPAGDATSYELEVLNTETSGKSWTVRNISGETQSLTVGADLPAIGEALLNGELHQFTLQAKNDSGVSISAVAFATPSAMPPATVGVRWLEEDFSETEGGQKALTLVLSSSVERDVTVPLWRVYEGTASPADVVFPDPFSITIPAGSTRGSLTISVVDDDLPEPDEETVQIGFSQLPDGIAFESETARSTTRLRLWDNDLPLMARFERKYYEVQEGGSVDVTLLLNKTNPGVLGTLNLSRESTTASSGDLVGVPPQVTFLPHVTRLTFTLEAPEDTVDENYESVRISLIGAESPAVRIGSPGWTEIRIADNDDPLAVSFDKPSYTVAEGSRVNVRVLLNRAPGATREVTLSSGPLGGATTSDYRGVPASVTFGPQQTEAVFAVTAVKDTEAETGEQVLMALQPDLTNVIKGSPWYAFVNLTDTALSPVTVAYEQESYSAGEGGAAVEVALVLDQAPGRQVTVPVAHAGEGGASAADYNSAGIPASVTFGPTEIRKSFTVSATADMVAETAERVRFTIPNHQSLPPGVEVGTPPAATVHLIDTPPPAVSYEQASYTVQEGGQVEVAVVLDRAPGQSVTVDLTRANQGATTTDDDYGGVPASVTFAATETRKTFTVFATQDGVFEIGESVRLGFAALPAGLNAGATPETTVHLTEDPALAVRVGYEQNSYTAVELLAPVEVAVVLDREPGRSVTVSLTRANEGGASDEDYSGVPASVTFGPVETRKTFTVSAKRDGRDPGESVLLGFASTLPEGVTAGTWPTARVHLPDATSTQLGTTVRFERTRYIAHESGRQAHVALVLSSGITRRVVVPLAATHLGGASDEDYSGVPANVTFARGRTRATFTVTASADTDTPEPGESVRLAFDRLPLGLNAAAPSTTVVELLDAAAAVVSVRFELDSYTAKEGGPPARVAVVLDQAPGRSLTIPLTATNEGAVDSDYTGVPASVTFAPDETRRTFTVNARRDYLTESGESVRLAFGTLVRGVITGMPSAATVHLVDAATTLLRARFERDSYTAREGGPDAEVAVVLDRAPERQIRLRVAATSGGGATEGDYEGVPTSVTLNVGDTRATFSVGAVPDSIAETGEHARLRFAMLPAGVSTATPDEATVHLTDATVTAAAVSFERGSYNTREGGAGAVVGVVLDQAPGRAITVPLATTNQGTTTDADWSGVPAGVTFAAADTRATFTVTAAADTVWDPNESVRLGFTMLPAGVSPGVRPSTTVHLVDPTTRRVSVSFVQDSYITAEGEAGVQVGVMLNEPALRPVEVPLLKTNQGGATDTDYSKAPVAIPDRVAFAATEALHTFTITAHDDVAFETGESVRFRLGALPAGVDYGARRQATVALTEESEVPVTVRFARDSATAQEGGTGATVTVLLDRQPGRTVTVPLTRTNRGGATNADYNHAALPASVTFAATETGKTFTVTATDDNDAETGESVRFRTGDLPSGVTLGTPGTMTVHLTDASTQVLQVSFERDRYAAAEGDAATVVVQLDQTPDRAVDVGLAVTPGAGVTSADYSGIPASIGFAAGGATTRSFTVSALADEVDEALESLRLGLSMLPPGVSAGTHPETTVYLTDADKPPVRVSFEYNSYNARDRGPSAVVAVVLDRAPGRTVIVPLTKTNQGPTQWPRPKYSGVPDSVTFGPNETRRTFVVAAVRGSRFDYGDAVRLGFGSLAPTVEPGRYENTTVHLLGRIERLVRVRFVRDTHTAREGGPNARVVVVMEPAPTKITTVRFTTMETGASASDYSGIPGAISFAAGRSSTNSRAAFTVTAVQDSDEESGEAVEIGFAPLPPAVSLGSPPETTVHLTDAGTTPVQVRFERYSYTAVEGGAGAMVAVLLDQAPGRTVVVPLTQAGLGGVSADDYSGVPASVTFAATDTRKMFTVTATADSVLEAGEQVRLGFEKLPGDVTTGTPEQTIVHLTDVGPPAVQVSVADVTAVEGDSAAFTVSLSQAVPTADVTVRLSTAPAADDTATAGDDYTELATALTISAGTTARTVSVSTTEDSLLEPNETFTVALQENAALPPGVSVNSTAATATITDDDAVTATVAADAGSVAEGEDAVFTVTLSGGTTSAAATVTYETGGTASSGEDYTAPYTAESGTLTIGAGESTVTLTVATLDDALDEADETLSMTLTAASTVGEASVGDPGSAEVTITDGDDPPNLEVDDVMVTEGNSGTVDAGFTVSLSAESGRDVTVDWATSDETATAGTDYTAGSGTLTFVAGDMTKNIDVAVIGDTVDEEDETFTVTLSNAGNAGISDATGIGTITDDDATLSIGDASANEGDKAEFTVSLSQAAAAAVVVSVSTSDGTAMSTSDYTAVSGMRLTIAAGDTSATVEVQTTEDTVLEGSETYTANMEAVGDLPVGVVLGTVAGTGTITDDDAVTATVAADAGSVAEGEDAVFTVTLSGGTTSAATTVTYETGGTASSGEDYTAPYTEESGTLTIGAGESTVTLTVATLDDALDEADETLSMTLTAASTVGEASVGDPNSAEVTITDGDDPPNLEVDDVMVTEGNSGTVDGGFTVSLSAESGRDVTVDWATSDETATAGTDYTAESGTLTFVAGDTTKNIDVAVTGDTVNEADETFTVTLSNAGNAGISDATGTGTITDDDAVTATVAADAGSVAEGEDAVFTVTLSGGTTSAATTVTYETGGTASSGEDYTAPYTAESGTLTIGAGESTVTLTVATLDDALDEADETLSMTLTAASTVGEASVGDPDSAEVTITDGDDPPNLEVDDVTVPEGNSGTVDAGFTVSLSAESGRDVTVDWATSDDTATAGTDYTAGSGTLTFVAGDTTKNVDVAVIGDTVDEADETFTVTLSNAGNAGISDATGTGTITDDDATVSVEGGSATEGSEVTFKAKLSAAVSSDVVLGWTTGDDDTTGARQATAGTDYTEVTNGSVTITAGQTEATFTVSSTQDTDTEGDETFKVTITGTTLPAGVTIGTASAVGTIEDDDGVTVSVEGGSATEGSEVTFKAKLSAAVGSNVVLGWTTGDDDTSGARQATAGTDYTEVTNGSVTITAGQTEATFTVSSTQDRDTEGDETFKVTISETAGDPLPGGVTIGTASAIGTIEDDDGVTVSVEGGSATEGSEVTFKATLSAAVGSNVVLGWTTGDDDTSGARQATAGTDYTEVTNGSVTITAGQTEATFTVSTTQDRDTEGDETFKVTITGTTLPGGVTIGTASAVGTIEDDDGVTVSVAGGSATEGSEVTFKATLSAAVGSNVVLGWTTGDDDTSGARQATAGTDYTEVTNGSVTITAGQTEATITVSSTQDTDTEGDETFKVTITGTTLPAGVTIVTASAIGTIEDDDGVTVSVEGGSATEGSAVTFKAKLSAAVGSNVVLGWTTGDDTSGARQATAGTDYTEVTNGSVTITAGQSEATFTVSTTEDTDTEGDETFKVTITGTTLPGGVTIGTASAIGTIEDDDGVTVSVEGGSATEGAAVTFKAKLSAAVSSDVVLGWTTGDDDTSGARQATAGTDYTEVTSGSVTITAGQSEASFTVSTTSDTDTEGDETFKVTITGTTLPGGVTIGTASAVGTIEDDDGVTVSVAGGSATEGSEVTFKAKLSTAVGSNVVLGWTTGDDDTSGARQATAGTDYTEVTSGSVTITAGQSEASFTVSTTEDTDTEGDETFKVTITGTTLPAGVTIGTASAVGTIEDDDGVTVSVEGGSATEGSEVTFKAKLSTAVGSNVVLGWTTGDDDTSGARQATAGTDYTEVTNGSVTITAGQTEATFTVSTRQDTDTEGDETFKVTITGTTLPGGVTIGTASAIGTIEDDDDATVSVEGGSATEGSEVTFKAKLSAAVSSDVVLGWTTGDDDTTGARQATAGTDYTEVTNGSVTITAGQTEATFTVSSTQDTDTEGDETFKVTITGTTLPAGVTIGTASAVGTIEDDDGVTVSVEGGSATEGSEVTFKAKLSAAVGSNVVLGWTTGDDDTSGARQATAGTDYTEVTNGSVTITAGQTEATFTVSSTQDRDTEGDETFKVTISETAGDPLPGGVTIGTASAIGTIEDDDGVTVSVEGGSATEGSEVTFKATLSAAVGSNVVLGWTTGDDDTSGARQATAGTDYTEVTNGSVTITAGQTEATFTVSTTQDRDTEGDETFKVTITGTTLPGGVTIGTASAVGTIEDDDGVTVSVAGGSATEGSEVTFKATLSAAVGSNVVLGWTTGDDDTSGARQATAGTDYTEVTNGSVTITAGQTEATITVSSTQDTDTEGDETFKVTITGTTLPAGVTIVTASAIGTIEDDDGVTVSVEGGSATEGSAVTFKAKLSAAVGSNVVLGWTTGDDTSGARQATAGTDYTEVTNGSVTITAGQSEATFTVSTTEDTDTEGDETFKVTITGTTLPGGVTIGTASAIGTIEDDDGVTVSVEGGSATEGAAVTFKAKLSAAVSSDVVLGWTTGDDDTSGARQATAGTDYTEVTSGSVTITAGQSEASFTVSTTSDTDTEGDETFKVTITGTTLPGGVTIGTASAVGTIEDDDGVTVSVAGGSATEGSEVTFKAKLSTAVGSNVVLGWTTGDDDTSGARQATAGTDYTEVTSGSVTITAGQSEASFTVSTTEDTDTEGDETFKVTITGTTLPAGVTIGTASAVGTIEDDDGVTVSVEGGSATEGSEVTFKAKLSTAVGSNVVLGWTTGDDDTSGARQATAGTDYTEVTNGSVTITAGQTEATFTVSTRQDTDTEGDETFKVTITGTTLPGGVTIGTASAIGTIEDDDGVTVSVEGGSATEGSAVTFKAKLSAAVGSNVVLGWTTGDDDTSGARQATAGTDYTEVTNGSVTITAGQTEATFTVSTTQDTDTEGDETFKVTITGTTLPAGVTIVTASAIGTIEDDDGVTVSVEGGSATEGSEVTFKAKLSSAVGSNVVLGWTTGDDDTSGARQATAGTDYTEVTNGSVTITAGQSEASFTVSTTEDTDTEGDETFKVTITGTTLPAGVTIGTASAVGTIEDDDGVTVSVAGGSATEGSEVTFKAKLSTAVGSNVVLGWTTGDDDTSGARQATAGTDYTEVTSGSVTITAGQSEASFTVSTTEDTDTEGDETFKVTITGTTLPAGVTIGTASAVGTIEDDDGVTVSVEGGSATEGSEVTFKAKLSTAVGSNVVLGWTTGDDDTSGARQATAGTDYTEVTNGSVTITAGQTEATFTVSTTQDTDTEGDETFKVTITGTTLPGGVTIGTASAIGTIEDDDGVTVSVEGGSATEGSAVTFKAKLSAAVGSNVVLGWTTGDDDTSGAWQATAGTDYTEVTSGSVTITAGQSEASFTVSTTSDTDTEGDETFKVTITGTTLPAGVTIGTASAIGTIEDDDGVTVSVAGGSATEGSAVTFKATLSAAVGSNVVLGWTTGDDDTSGARQATAGTDYTEVTNGSVTITAGQSEASFTVSTTEDTDTEGDETFKVTITGTTLPAGVTIGTASAVGTIEDDDGVTVSIGDASATEGDTAEFTVSLSQAASAAVVVSVSTSDGTASAPSDYTAVSLMPLTIATGGTSAAVAVQTTEDGVPEGSETFTVSMEAVGDLPPEVVLGTATGTGTIVDDDDATVPVGDDRTLTATITADQAEVVEGAAAGFTVHLIGRTTAVPVTLGWHTNASTATAGADYQLTPPEEGTSGTVTIAAGATSGTLTIATLADEIFDPGETLTVTLDPPPPPPPPPPRARAQGDHRLSGQRLDPDHRHGKGQRGHRRSGTGHRRRPGGLHRDPVDAGSSADHRVLLDSRRYGNRG